MARWAHTLDMSEIVSLAGYVTIFREWWATNSGPLAKPSETAVRRQQMMRRILGEAEPEVSTSEPPKPVE